MDVLLFSYHTGYHLLQRVGCWSLADDMMHAAAAPEARMGPSLRNAPVFAVFLPFVYELCTLFRVERLPAVA